MANPEHVAVVRRGAKAIAKWRLEHPGERLDLKGADLSGANLSDADVRGANLSGAKLWRTHLSGADLRLANLSEANLRRAKLNGADLTLANLTVAKLNGANLSGANLMGAYLGGAYLEGANLSRANLDWASLQSAWVDGANMSDAEVGSTSFGSIDLSKVGGLVTVGHRWPSSIGVDTLLASVRGAGGKLTPELRTFFLGAGVPKELLKEVAKIVGKVEYYTCFISYGQPDVEFATKLCQDLEGRGVSCWLYDMDKTVGKRTWGDIGEARRGTDKFVVLCSAKALVRDGVLEEIEDQINEDPERLVPISLDNLWKEPGFPVIRGKHNLKPELEKRNYADFANKPYEEALEDLLKGLRRPAVKKPRRKKG